MGITLAYQSINQLRRDIKESRMTITVFGTDDEDWQALVRSVMVVVCHQISKVTPSW
jgi:hypothetical protein